MSDETTSAKIDDATKPVTPPKKKRKWLRRSLIALAVLPVFLLGLWIAIHKVRWLGPLLADTGRAIFGTRAIAWLEEKTYGLQDDVNLATRKDEPPQQYWDVPPASAEPQAVKDAIAASAFHPKDVGPVVEKYGAAGDGQWVPIIDPRHESEAPVLYKTLLHPDRKRAWTGIAIVAIDLERAEVKSVAGTAEPVADPGAPKVERKGIIPESEFPKLIAAWNGGYKAEHGHWGYKIDGAWLLHPQPSACTFAKYDDGSYAIGTWKDMKGDDARLVFARQAPGCLVEHGKSHPALSMEDNSYWGAAIGGDTVIRRSAVGISEDKKTLFVGIGDAANAPVIASAMKHAGASSVAQLDVNFSFPRFLTYEPKTKGGDDLVAKPLCKGFEWSENEYIREKQSRDFFYLVRK